MKTTRLRLRLQIDHKGEYATDGYTDANGEDVDGVLDDMMSNNDTNWLKTYIIDADVPVPEQKVVAGVVVGEVQDV